MNQSATLARSPHPCAIIAHRGASLRAPENTLASVRLAWNIGSDAVEVDIHLSRDGQIVVMHDATTGRTANADHAISDLTAHDLQLLNAAAQHSPPHPFEKIPLLREIFSTIPKGKHIVVEIKDNRPELLEALKVDIRRSGLADDQIILGTFDYDFAVETKRRFPHHEVVWINAHYHNVPAKGWLELTDMLITRLREGGLDGMNTGVCHDYDPQEFFPHLQRIQSAGFKLRIWTVDDFAKGRLLGTLPVDGITTNAPDVMLEALATPVKNNGATPKAKKAAPIPSHSLADRIQGCWIGKSIGGTLGLPAEGRTERLHYTFYDPVPDCAPPNDDLELQLVWLHLAENSKGPLTQADFAAAWVRHIHYMWDEYGRCRWNLRRGVPVEHVGTFENPFASGMGSPIRSEIWACLFPGDPDSAAYYAALDASLDHGSEGMDGEVLFAAWQSAILGGASVGEALDPALSRIHTKGETARAVELVRTAFQAEMEAWACREELLRQHGNENFTHAPLNVALTVWALLYGGGDFEKSILLATNAGYDTDCTAATVGATLGLAFGAQAIPPRWSAPIGQEVLIGPGILDIHAPKTLTELTQRTMALIGRLERKSETFPITSTSPPDLAKLPGTILIKPHSDHAATPWANGELPESIKAAGGAEWTWETPTGEPCHIVCLAREGATLRMDGDVVLRCPPGLPYVPAPHRCAPEARTLVRPSAGSHRIRLDLDRHSPTQDASILLTYPDFHLRPWTIEDLPLRAQLHPTNVDG